MRKASKDDLALLHWVTDEVAAGRIDCTSVTALKYEQRMGGLQSLSPEAAGIKVRRWGGLLSLARMRPEACALVLVRVLDREGFDRETVMRTAQRIVPLTASKLAGAPSDVDYARAELANLFQPAYERLVAVARHTAKYNRSSAERLARQAASQEPGRWEAHVCLAEIAEAGHQFSTAVEEFGGAVAKGCPDRHADWVRCMNRAGYHQLALETIDHKIGAARTEPVELERARALRGLGQWEAAIKQYSRLKRTSSELAAEIADCYLKLDRPADAIKTAASGARTGDPECLRISGLAHYALGHMREATEALRRYVSAAEPVDIGLEEWRCLSVAALACGEYDEVLEATEKALSLDPQDKSSVWARGQAFISLRRFQDALDLYQTRVGQTPPLPHLVFLHIETGQHAEANELCHLWFQKRPRDPWLWGLMGYLKEREGRWDEALAYYGNACIYSPQDSRFRDRYLALRYAHSEGLLPTAADSHMLAVAPAPWESIGREADIGEE